MTENFLSAELAPCRMSPLLAGLVFVSSLWLLPTELHAGAVLKGHIYDAVKSTEKLRLSGIQSDSFQEPIAGQEVDLLLPSVREAPFKVSTDADGGFELDTGLDVLPETALVVAHQKTAEGERFSPSVPATGKLDLFLYPITESGDDVQALATFVHDFQTVGDRKLLRVRGRVQLWNRGDRLFVGSSSRYGKREVFRVPIPPGAEVVRQSAPVPGLRWRRSEDGGHLIIDEPVAGLPDLREAFETLGGPGSWEVEYLIDPPLHFTPTYEFGVRPASRATGDAFDGFLVYAPHERIQIGGETMQQFRTGPEQQKDPFTGEIARFDVYGPARPILAGQSLVVPMDLDAGSLGRVSPKALFWHGGTLLVALVATLFGFLLSSRRPPVEAVLDGLSSEEVLDRIAELDRRYERKEIAEAEYRRFREPLIEIAAEELEASGAHAGAGASTGATSSLSADVQRLVASLRENETRTEDPDAIRERAHLLEALYKAVSGSSETRAKT